MPLSSAKAEFISAFALVHEVNYLCKFLANLCSSQTEQTLIFVHEASTACHLELHKLDSKLNTAQASMPPNLFNLHRSIGGH